MSVSEQVSTANLRQWQALTEPRDYADPFHEPAPTPAEHAAEAASRAAAERAEEVAGWWVREAEAQHPVSCDGCHEAHDLEECVITAGALLFCAGCRDAETDGEWVCEEWFEGEGEGL